MIFGGIAAVSLLVAAINIINTMTMAIYERTREIGVMKVLGCELGNIRTMFLLESSTIGFIGGLIGLGVQSARQPCFEQPFHNFSGWGRGWTCPA